MIVKKNSKKLLSCTLFKIAAERNAKHIFDMNKDYSNCKKMNEKV